MSKTVKLRCFDVCCGAGALTHGFARAGATILGGIDNNHQALATVRANYPDAAWQLETIEDFASSMSNSLNGHPIWKANTLLAGLPCQGFSCAGKRDPGDPRNILFRHFLHIVSAVEPEFFVIENVAGMVSGKYAESFEELRRAAERLRYRLAIRLLDASDFGVAQRRKRVFIIGSRRWPAEYAFECIRLSVGDKNVREALRGLPRTRETRQASHVFMKHSPRVRQRLRSLKPGGPLSYRRLSWDEKAPTIVAGHRALPVHPSEPRAISVREAARLQGFDDDYTFEGSNSAQIEQVANAVPPPLALAVAKGMQRMQGHSTRIRGRVFAQLERRGVQSGWQVLDSRFRMMCNGAARQFPWRGIRDPYKVLITEILLQRTNAELAQTVWQDVLRLVPTPTAASKVDLRSLGSLTRRIGIKHRARTIKLLGQTLVRRHRGKVPEALDDLMRLPGVGLYIASAVRVFAFGHVDFPVDSNAFRFASRFFGIRLNARKSEARQLREFFLLTLRQRDIREYVYGFLDFAGTICKPTKPLCERCSLRRKCKQFGT